VAAIGFATSSFVPTELLRRSLCRSRRFVARYGKGDKALIRIEFDLRSGAPIGFAQWPNLERAAAPVD
jgi:hypothetical protein